MSDHEEVLASDKESAKANTALLTAFKQLADDLSLNVRIDTTNHKYDSLALGNKPLKNALCIKQDSTTFFTADASLREKLASPGTSLEVEPAHFRKPSRHNEYRFLVKGVTPESIVKYRDLFEQVVRNSVSYVENPIASQHVRNG